MSGTERRSPMIRWYVARLAALAWTCLSLVMACAAGCGGSDHAETTTSTTAHILVCDVAQGEYYILSAMNHKLAYYSDFSEAIGMRSVSDCDDARSFMRSYADYGRAHPGFDAHEPREPAPRPPTTPPPAHSELTIAKVFGGTPLQDAPVVSLGSTALCPGFRRTASGTFIAKDWILTAAHTFTEPCADGTFPRLAPAGGWTSLTTDWADSNGNPIQPGSPAGVFAPVAAELNTASALVYVDPLFVGGGSSSFDFALVYLYSDFNDPFLPPNPALGSTRHLLLEEPTSTDVMTFEGWGATKVLQAMPLPGPITDISLFTFTSTVENQANSFTVCSGDSGGPALRLLQVTLPSGDTVTEQVIEGVVSKASQSSPPISDAFPTCNTYLPGDSTVFARVDLELPFIESRMQRWNGPNFHCSLLFRSGASEATVAQCWGAPCLTSDDCPSGQLCKDFSEPPPTQCPVCTSGTCNCVFGQCLTAEGLVETDSDAATE